MRKSERVSQGLWERRAHQGRIVRSWLLTRRTGLHKVVDAHTAQAYRRLVRVRNRIVLAAFSEVEGGQGIILVEVALIDQVAGDPARVVPQGVVERAVLRQAAVVEFIRPILVGHGGDGGDGGPRRRANGHRCHLVPL